MVRRWSRKPKIQGSNPCQGYFVFCIVLVWTFIFKEGNILFNEAFQHILFMFVWRRTYGKGQFREEATFSD